MQHNIQNNTRVITRPQESELVTNKVLRNTYGLLSLTLLFSALTAGYAMVSNAAPMGWWTLLGYFALLFVTTKLRNSVWGLVSVFALTGFLGYTLGPILNLYVTNLNNGAELVMLSLGMTGLIFFATSAYVLTTRKELSRMGGFLTIGLLIAFFTSLAAIFFSIPAMSLAASAMFVLLSSGLIMYQTSAIIHGGETNYIMATVTLYVSLYNIFLSLLQLLGAFSNRD